MKELYFVICDKYGKFEILSIICSKYKNEDEKLFKEVDSIEILKVLGLIEDI